MCIWFVDSAGVALGQRWRQEPGRWEFTGKMVVRPLQIEHWMERGFTREQAQVRYQRAVEYTVDTLGEHVYRYHERMDEYWFFVPPGRSENDIGEQLIATGYYRYVCPNWKTYPASVASSEAMINECPDDEYLENQWHLKRIEACAGWQIHTEGDDDIVIGVVDSGMRVTHEDLSTLSQYRREGFNVETGLWESESGDISDTVGHGAKVLGIAAATGDNGDGVSGIGWSLRHRMLKQGEGSDDEVLECLWTSAEVGDRVLCSTHGVPFAEEETWKKWTDNAYAIRQTYDVLIVHAAGNHRNYSYDSFPDLIIVGGTDISDGRWIQDEEFGSPVGLFIDVMAPAVSIFTTAHIANDSYAATSFGGTSWATPQVAGLCALIWSYNSSLTADEVQELLFAGCEPIDDYNENLHGHGRINVFNSLALASGAVWTRDPHPGQAGVSNRLKAAGAANGATVRFYYGSSTGQTAVSGCANVYVGIANASVLGEATAGSNGAAIYEATVPSGWAGQTRYLQAVDLSDCRVSNLIQYTFPSN